MVCDSFSSADFPLGIIVFMLKGNICLSSFLKKIALNLRDCSMNADLKDKEGAVEHYQHLISNSSL